VLNEDRVEFIKSPAEVVMIPGSARAVARLNRAGFKVALCTNQSAIGRGIITRERLAQEGGHLDAIFFCPHAPDSNCPCRKPKPGMLLDALRRFGASAADTP